MKKYRFKTEKEFIEEYGKDWGNKVNWNPYGEMDYLLGIKLGKKQNKLANRWGVFYIKGWNITHNMLIEIKEEPKPLDLEQLTKIADKLTKSMKKFRKGIDTIVGEMQTNQQYEPMHKILENSDEAEGQIILKIPKKRWRAKREEYYYYINHHGCIRSYPDYYDDIESYRYNSGNYFKTKEQAEKARDKQLIRQELEDLALELNTEPVDWNDFNQLKCCIKYDFIREYLGQTPCHGTYFQGAVYCTNKDFLEIALERIGEDRLKLLFGIEE